VGRLDGDSFKKPTILSQLIPMKKTFLALALAAGLTSFAGSANAELTYNFTFQGDPSYGYSNLISGYLTLNDTEKSATSFYVTSGFGFPNPTGINFATQEWFLAGNSFTVNNGQITSGLFIAVANKNGGSQDNSIPNYTVWLQEGNNSFTESYYAGDTLYNAKNTSGGLTFTPTDTAAVPEPSQVAASILLVAGIAGFVIMRRRKESALALAA